MIEEEEQEKEKLRDQIKQFYQSYLIEKENIIDLSSFMKTLKYDKKNSLIQRLAKILGG